MGDLAVRLVDDERTFVVRDTAIPRKARGLWLQLGHDEFAEVTAVRRVSGEVVLVAERRAALPATVRTVLRVDPSVE